MTQVTILADICMQKCPVFIFTSQAGLENLLEF